MSICSSFCVMVWCLGFRQLKSSRSARVKKKGKNVENNRQNFWPRFLINFFSRKLNKMDLSSWSAQRDIGEQGTSFPDCAGITLSPALSCRCKSWNHSLFQLEGNGQASSLSMESHQSEQLSWRGRSQEAPGHTKVWTESGLCILGQN